MAKLNLTQAAKAVGIARGTLYTHIKQGKVTVEVNKKGEKVIDTGELVRAYGELKTEEKAETPKFVVSGQNLRQRISILEEQSKELRKDKEHLQKDKEELLGIIKHQQTLLLPAPDNKKKGFFRRLFG